MIDLEEYNTYYGIDLAKSMDSRDRRYVYVVKSNLTGYVKIGMSKLIGKRFKDIQNIGGFEITPLLIIPCVGAKNLEKDLHDEFDEFRTKFGEWFKYEKELEEFVNNYYNKFNIDIYHEYLYKRS